MAPTSTRPSPNEPVPTGAAWHALQRWLGQTLARPLDALGLTESRAGAALHARLRTSERKLRQAQQARRRLGEQLAAAEAEIRRLQPLATLAQRAPALAHDLNTPIANARLVGSSLRERLSAFRACLASGELRRADLANFLDDLAEGLAILATTGERAEDLAGALKHLAIDAASLRRRRFALAELVGGVMLSLQPSLRRRALNIDIAIAPELTLDSYPGPLGQVLTNLVQNALVHAFPEGRSGTLRLVASQPDARHLRLLVEDDGVGMSRAVRAKIFDEFFTTAGARGGSGIGLHYARQLVEQTLGGRISCRSTPGHGSRFTLTLPLQAP